MKPPLNAPHLLHLQVATRLWRGMAGIAISLSVLMAVAWTLAVPAAQAQVPTKLAPQELIATVTQDILETIRNDRSLQQRDLKRLAELVDQKVMPVVNFSRMTALAVGRNWRQATPEQQQRLVVAFRDLLVLTYSEALRFAPESTIDIRPARYLPTDEDVVVRTVLLRSGKEPIPLDYRLQKTAEGWKIYDFNVLGLWIVEHYRGQFGQLVSAKGIDGLIVTLEQKNQALRQAMAQ